MPELPRLPEWLDDGWTLNAIVTAQTGRPIPIVTSDDTSGRFNFHQRPNLVPGVDPIRSDWSPDSGYLNPLAFQQPAFGTFGNSGRNTLTGPGFRTLNVALVKHIRFGPRASIDLRAEAFNVINRVNYDLPDAFFGSPTFGRILSAGSPRRFQFGVRTVF